MHSGWRMQALPTAQGTQCSAVHWRSLSWSVQLEQEAFCFSQIITVYPSLKLFSNNPVFP